MPKGKYKSKKGSKKRMKKVGKKVKGRGYVGGGKAYK